MIDSIVVRLLKSALNSLLFLCYLISDICAEIMRDADRHCARLRYQFQEKTFQFFGGNNAHSRPPKCGSERFCIAL